MISTQFLSSTRRHSSGVVAGVAQKLLLSLLLASLAPAGLAIAETETNRLPVLETEVLIPNPGYQDEANGVRVESVEQSEDGQTVKIYVTVPHGENGDIEEVIVLGQPDKKTKIRTPLLQKQKFEVVKNLEEGRSGIVIYLGKREDFLLKLNYTEPRPDVEPDVFNR